MRLTIDLLRYAASYINPIGQREINLRKYAIPSIENLGILNDGYDTIDLSENSIVIIDNFANMKRLNTLLLHNNKIRRIAKGLGSKIINLENLMLNSNQIMHVKYFLSFLVIFWQYPCTNRFVFFFQMSDLEGIEELTNLIRVSLIGNPVTKDRNYRLWMIAKLPKLKYLDFKKIQQSERIEAQKIFGKSASKSKQSSKKQETKQNSKQKSKRPSKQIKDGNQINQNDQNNSNSNKSSNESGYMQLNPQQRTAITVCNSYKSCFVLVSCNSYQ